MLIARFIVMLCVVSLLAASTQAQTQTQTPGLDTVFANTMTFLAQLRGQIGADQDQIAQLQRKIVVIAAERDQLKADAAKAPEEKK